MPELRSDERLQLRRRGPGIELGLAVFIFIQALAALVQSDRLEVLLWFTRETWLLLTLLWAKNLFLAALAAGLAVAAYRWLEKAREMEPPAARARTLGASAAAAMILGAALRWMWPTLLPPAQFSDTFSEIERVLRDPRGAPWIGTTPFPGSAHDRISNLYARAAHASVVAFGGGAEGLLSVAALPGTLLLPAVLWLGLEVGGPAVGVLALWLVAFGAWPLNVARWGFTGSAMLPLLTAGLAALLAGHRTRRSAWGVLAGACLGLSLHTHPGAWATVGALFLWGIVRFAGAPEDRRLIATTALAGAIALAPFAWGFVREPSTFGGHLRDVHLQSPVRDVSAPSGAGATGLARRLLYNGLRYTALFTGATDPNVRHGLPARAKLPLLAGLAALFGAAASLRRNRTVGERALLVFAGGSLLAGVLSDPGAAPNSFRVCALIVPACIFAATSLRAAAVRVAALLTARPGLVAALAVAAFAAADTVPFLAVWTFDPAVEAGFEAGESGAGRILGLVGARSVTLDPGVVRHPIVVETTAREVSFRTGVPAWPLRAPAEMSGAGGGWYVSRESRLGPLCALRRCGHPIHLAEFGPEVDLVRLGP